ncbi:MAG: SusC/RagA family TonB-linked outer membrane protein [Bacteroidota bacterium]
MKTKFNGILTLLLAFVVQFTFAQDRTISGTVTDESGPLPGVSILIEGTSQGTETDFDGNYTLTANTGDVLRYSFVGMTTITRTVSDASVYNVTMVSSENTLDEVVVTALGIKREKKSLGYSTQEVKGDAVNTVKDPNFVNSLSGKVAGVDIKNSGTMGGSSDVIIRGYSSMYGNNQALFVVDGVPVSNLNTNGSGQQTGRGGYDYGNAAQDVNPDDIESVNILKGGAATALYGSRGANGVVIITTKKGKDRGKGIGVTISSSVTFNKMNDDTMVKYQKEYGAGYGPFYDGPGHGFFQYDFDGDGVDDLVTPTTEDASMGTAFDPNLMVYQWDSWYKELPTYMQASPWVAAKNNPTTYFETGITTFNSVSFDGANEKGSFRVGYTKFDQEGILPNSKIIRDNVDFGGSWKLTDKLTASAKATYVKTKGKGRYGTGYDALNPMQSFRQWFQVNVDIQDQKRAYFDTRKNITWNPQGTDDLSPIYFDNPYWTRYENFQNDQRDRVFGNVALEYELNDWLVLYGRMTLDTYSELQEERINVSSVDVSKYSRYNNKYTENNFDLMLRFNKDLTDNLNLNGVVGTNIMKWNRSSIYAQTNGGLNLPGLYTLGNSTNAINAPTEREYEKRVDGYYINASLGWANTLYLEGSYRRDYSSSLPRHQDSYDYFGGSASFLFSSLFNSDFLNLGKLRVGYARTGNSPNPLQVNDTYLLGAPIGGAPTADLPSTKNNANLEDEKSDEMEVGLEMAMLKNRLGFDLSVYNKVSKDLITPVSITSATGYTSAWLNAGEMENKGVELALWGSPVKTDNFDWTVTVNWAKNNSEVTALPQGLNNLLLAGLQGGVSINATVGQPYGTIRGSNYTYTNGQPTVISTNDPASSWHGKYLASDTKEVLGTYQPDWTGGINNAFRFGNLTFSFLIDMQKGGELFSLDQWYGQGTGLYDNTAGLNDLGNPLRAPVSEGGGEILPGVKEDGTPNDIRTFAGWYANGRGWARAVNAQHVYDAGFIKLREIALAYSLPEKLIDGTFIQGLTFTATGRNLWIIDKDLPYADPEGGLSSGNVQGYQSGVYPTTKDYGFSVKLQF